MHGFQTILFQYNEPNHNKCVISTNEYVHFILKTLDDTDYVTLSFVLLMTLFTDIVHTMHQILCHITYPIAGDSGHQITSN